MTDREMLERLWNAARAYAYASSTRTERLFGDRLRDELRKADEHLSRTGGADMREFDQ